MASYTLDTNILINMERLYPRDIFSGLWDSLEELIDADRACICYFVQHELSVGSDELLAWTKARDKFVCSPDDDEVALATAMSAQHPDWVADTKNAADPWVVAHGHEHKRSIVTEESRAGFGVVDKNQKIPNVADEYRVPVLKFFEFARAESWEFRR